MEFPTSGLWKLKVYIGNTLFGEMVLNVLKRYPLLKIFHYGKRNSFAK
jgi:hypothetical protein